MLDCVLDAWATALERSASCDGSALHAGLDMPAAQPTAPMMPLHAWPPAQPAPFDQRVAQPCCGAPLMSEPPVATCWEAAPPAGGAVVTGAGGWLMF